MWGSRTLIESHLWGSPILALCNTLSLRTHFFKILNLSFCNFNNPDQFRCLKRVSWTIGWCFSCLRSCARTVLGFQRLFLSLLSWLSFLDFSWHSYTLWFRNLSVLDWLRTGDRLKVKFLGLYHFLIVWKITFLMQLKRLVWFACYFCFHWKIGLGFYLLLVHYLLVFWTLTIMV